MKHWSRFGRKTIISVTKVWMYLFLRLGKYLRDEKGFQIIQSFDGALVLKLGRLEFSYYCIARLSIPTAGNYVLKEQKEADR